MQARRSGITAALISAVLLCTAYVATAPVPPDLAAQLARAGAVSRGARFWWQGWYGGINTATYSVVSAAVMSVAGAVTVGVLATVVICWCAADLLRCSVRPRAGAVACARAAGANLYSGRITFAAGMAVALAGLCLLRRGYRYPALACALLSGAVSPLAAMELCVGLVALAVVDEQRRRLACLGCVVAAAPVIVVSALFGQPSVMPFPRDVLLYASLVTLSVLVAPVPRVVRVMAGLTLAALIVAHLVPSPIGSNATRLPMLLAAPLLIATARWTDRGRIPATLMVLAVASWPVIGLSSDLSIARQASARPSFYTGLLAHLPPAGRSTSRLEVVEPETMGAADYLAGRMPLARGWERQIDVADNPLFYNRRALDPATVRTWLASRAVGWVGLPTTGRLDYGSTSEADLIRRGLPYLHLVWSDPHWRLFRVTFAAPVAAAPFTVTALTDTGVSFDVPHAARGTFRLAYSSLLVAVSATDPHARGCVEPGPGSDGVTVAVPAAGRWVISAAVDSLAAPCPR